MILTDKDSITILGKSRVTKTGNNLDNYNDLTVKLCHTLDQSKKKTINIFAIVIVLMIAVPEVIGHTFFDKSHPENSSVLAALALANKFEEKKHPTSPNCQLEILNDSSGAQVARAVGLHGQYGNFTCT